MIRVCILGVTGRMGRTILSLLQKKGKKFQVVAGVTKPGTMHEALDLGIRVVESLKEVISNTDVVIDFSEPSSTLLNACIVAQAKKALVVGTTGFNESQRNDFLEVASRIPCVFAPNMSVGVNVLFGLVEQASRILSEFDVEIIETHHKHKKDAPSGTALRLKKATSKEAPIHSIRAGDIVGDHTVIYATEGEQLLLTHKASSRDAFAKGAVLAAEWVVNKKPGIYDMQDVLGLRQS